ncbi:MAG: hypothetical protein LC789_11595 [Actinobacteria bacterium]|nr:hypothetical protein [Actinomycetota bacterium]
MPLTGCHVGQPPGHCVAAAARQDRVDAASDVERVGRVMGLGSCDAAAAEANRDGVRIARGPAVEAVRETERLWLSIGQGLREGDLGDLEDVGIGRVIGQVGLPLDNRRRVESTVLNVQIAQRALGDAG